MKDMFENLTIFRERATTELKFAIAELQWWKDRVASGLVKPEHAKRQIEAAKRVINTKRHLLGFPDLLC